MKTQEIVEELYRQLLERKERIDDLNKKIVFLDGSLKKLSIEVNKIKKSILRLERTLKLKRAINKN